MFGIAAVALLALQVNDVSSLARVAIAELGSGSPEKRIAAARLIAVLDEPAPRPESEDEEIARDPASEGLGVLLRVTATKSLSRCAKAGPQEVTDACTRSLLFLLRAKAWAHHGEPKISIEELTPLTSIGRAAIPEIGRVVTDQEISNHVRFVAILALSRLRDPVALDILLSQLRTAQGIELYLLAQSVVRYEDERVIPSIAACLGRVSTDYGMAAGNALEWIGPKSIPVLTQTLRSHPNPDARWEACLALRNLDGEGTRAIRQSCVKDIDPGVRAEGVLAIAEAPPANARDVLRPLLSDPDSSVRASVASSIGAMGLTGLESELALCTRDPEPRVVGAACKSLTALDPSKGLAVAKRLVMKESGDRLQAALEGLAPTKDFELEDRVLEIANSDDYEVRSTSIEALGRIQTEKSLSKLLELLGDHQSGMDYKARRGLALYGKAAASALKRAAMSANTTLAYHAIALLGELRVTDAAEIIARRSGDPELSSAAATALGLIGESTGADTVLALLKSRDTYTRSMAIEATAKLNDRRAIPILLKLLDKRGPLAVDLAKSLATFKVREAIPTLLKMSAEPEEEEEIRDILESLARISPEAALQAIRQFNSRTSYCDDSALAALKIIGLPAARTELDRLCQSDDFNCSLYSRRALRLLARSGR